LTSSTYCFFLDPIIYIYTSGTTGLPKVFSKYLLDQSTLKIIRVFISKPAVIKQSRYYGAGFAFFEASGLTSSDIVYVTLPIYHASGNIIGVGAATISGATVVLRKKFSASNFWEDAIRYNCTAFVYVGEICRFLVNQPPSPLDKKHKIRKAYGNGLRKNVWVDFKNRFGIRCIEFYGASEGNCTLSTEHEIIIIICNHLFYINHS
jgi:acyl-CoA synthetase (AMP-forming)/AMP-acid ligase II